MEVDQNQSPLAEGVVDVAGARQFSGQSRTKIYAAMQRGELPYYVDGSRRFIAKRDLIKWMESRLKPIGA